MPVRPPSAVPSHPLLPPLNSPTSTHTIYMHDYTHTHRCCSKLSLYASPPPFSCPLPPSAPPTPLVRQQEVPLVVALPPNRSRRLTGEPHTTLPYGTYVGLVRTIYIYTVYIRYFWQENHQNTVIYGVYIRSGQPYTDAQAALLCCNSMEGINFWLQPCLPVAADASQEDRTPHCIFVQIGGTSGYRSKVSR